VTRAEAGVESQFVFPRYAPMAPTLVREPFHRRGWIYEEKGATAGGLSPVRTAIVSAW